MNPISLSDGEWKIMNHLWDKAPQTIMELTAGLQEETGWDKHTVITMLGRMEKKGAVSYETQGRTKQFYPLVSKNEVCIQETKGFLNKVYCGSIGMMVNAMVKNQQLSAQDIQELYDILNQAEKAQKD
jgi:BlaI family penicillinase repressor